MKDLYKKTTLLIIIILFLGVSIIPATGSVVSKNKTLGFNELVNSSKNLLFDRCINLVMRFQHLPSVSACIIKSDQVVWEKAYGLMDIENEKPATLDTIYLVGSISKTITATAMMQLIENESYEVDLDDDVNDFLPFSLRNPKYPDVNITFRMLLSHSSSIATDYYNIVSYGVIPGDPDVIGFPYPWLKEYLTPGGIAYSPSVWSDDRPGQKGHYSNIGFSIIGYLVEIISGQNLEEYCQEHIFEPLGMFNTSFRLASFDTNNIAIPYSFESRKFIRHPHYGITVINHAGSLRTSIKDLSCFLIAHMNGGVYNNVRILNESTIELMHTPHSSVFTGCQYGLGVYVRRFMGEKLLGHHGAYFGAYAWMYYYPKDKTGIIFLINKDIHGRKVYPINLLPIQLGLLWKARKL